MLHQVAFRSRRLNTRVESPEGVYVFWRCGGRDEIAQVRNLSLGGLFIETASPRNPGTNASLDFLVQEGQIRAEATVQHVTPGRGLGLKFTAIVNQDRSHLEGLVTRLRIQTK